MQGWWFSPDSARTEPTLTFAGELLSEGMLEPLVLHKHNADAVHFIADMLETDDAENDEFANLLRTNPDDPAEIDRIVKAAGA